MRASTDTRQDRRPAMQRAEDAVPVEIAVAVLRRPLDRRILARRRRPDEKLAGLWEFPGGKVEAGETPLQAAAREVLEEMGGGARELALMRVHEHDYPDRRVRIHVFEGTFESDPAPPDGAAWAWMTAQEMSRLPIPPANRVIVDDLAGDS